MTGLTLEQIWPPYGITVTAGDLELRAIRDDDIAELAELALAGVHDPDRMPFSTPWTDADPKELPRRMSQHYWETRAVFSPEKISLDLAVRRNGELLGAQGFFATDYPTTRTAETGSWLGLRFHGQGVGTLMRQAVCVLLFDHLGAEWITSAAFLDNPASLGVSRKVGYRPNGLSRYAVRAKNAENQNLLLRPDDFVRPQVPVTVAGVEPLVAYLGLDGAGVGGDG